MTKLRIGAQKRQILPTPRVTPVRDGLRVAETSLGADTTVIDVEGALVVPGFEDTRTHLGWAGEAFWNVNWTNDVTDHATALARLRLAAGRIEPGLWLLGGNWSRASLADCELPTLAELDAAVPSTPPFLRSEDGSVAVVNSRAVELFQGQPGHRTFPDSVDRDSAGRPTGHLFDPATRVRATVGIIPPANRYR